MIAVAEGIELRAQHLERHFQVENERSRELRDEDVLDHLLAQHRMLWGPGIEHGRTHPWTVSQVNENSDYNP